MKDKKTDNNLGSLHAREAPVMIVMILPQADMFDNSEPIKILTIDFM